MKSREQDRLKVVLDHSVYVAALLSSSGASAAIFEMIVGGDIYNFYTTEVINELKQVLSRAKFKLTLPKIDSFISLILDSSFEVQKIKKFDVKKCRDPRDDKFLSLSKQMNADYLISLDRDVTILKHIGKTKILLPAEFLEVARNMGL